MSWRRGLVSPADAPIGVGVGVLGVAEMVASDAPPVAIGCAALLAVPMFARRVIPEISTVVVVALLIALTSASGQDTPLAAAIALVAAVGTLAALREPVRSAPVLGALLGAVAVMVAIQGAPLDVAFASFLYGGSWLVGAELHRRRRQTQTSDERAAQALLALETETEAARSEERLRMARELHDVVAHSLSVVTLHTQAVRRRLSHHDGSADADRNQEALQAAEEAAREALAELRRLFGLLRSDDAPPLEPQPGFAQIGRLADALETAGVRTTLQVDADLELSPGLDLAVYRVVQEATTNILKHAQARQARIAVTREHDGLQVLISDDGVGGASTTDGGGHGLIGLRERVSLYGGDLRVGEVSTGGFEVEASLPLRADA